MAESGHIHKHGREHEEDEPLDDTDEELEGVERHRGDHRDEEGHDGDQDLASEDIAEETEGKGDDFGQIRDELEDTDEGVDRIAEVKEFFQVVEPLEFEAVDLHHDHGDQTEGEGRVDIGCRAAQDGDKDFFAMEHTVEADGAGAGEETRPVAGDDEDKEGHD